ncbi:hypothetical protein BELL_1712g00010 [Botrytis elliptica]|uniref:Protein kinase domain-containing protein n=1 Tax=Botrytis elliptica TaxID=278938 RepID=A0A4Z1HYZ9_9HELO|nr:hypothetical protein EAE99_010225 [Botrytis elliptica]TGO51690.1 hypothetical protein BELL_1712g00010 [Botrytis elliptica]
MTFRCELSDNGKAESLQGYVKGVLFPIDSLPYKLSEKYRIITKLGYGGFSTVWLAIGIHKDNLGRWFAIKISQSTSADEQSQLKKEMKRLENKSSRIVPCIETFRIVSSYNAKQTHLCLVLKASGPSVKEYVSNKNPTFDQRRLIAINCTKALMDLHKQNIFLIDLSSGNFLMKIHSSDIRELSETQIEEKVGVCESKPVETQHASIKLPEYIPKRIYKSTPLYSLVGEELDIDVIDVVPHSSAPLGRTQAYSSPEVLEQKPSTIQSNIWGLGCLICEIMTLGELPFEDGHYVPSAQDDYFDEDEKGKIKYLSKVCHNPRKRHHTLDIDQAKDVAKFLGKIFVRDPASRPTAETILDCLKDPKFLGKKPSGSGKRKDSAVSLSPGPVKNSTSKTSSPPRYKTTKDVSHSKSRTIVVPNTFPTDTITLPDRKKSSNPAIQPKKGTATESTGTEQKERKNSRRGAESSEPSGARRKL